MKKLVKDFNRNILNEWLLNETISEFGICMMWRIM